MPYLKELGTFLEYRHVGSNGPKKRPWLLSTSYTSKKVTGKGPVLKICYIDQANVWSVCWWLGRPVNAHFLMRFSHRHTVFLCIFYHVYHGFVGWGGVGWDENVHVTRDAQRTAMLM